MGKIIELKKAQKNFNDQINDLIALCHEDLESINTLIIEKLDS